MSDPGVEQAVLIMGWILSWGTLSALLGPRKGWTPMGALGIGALFGSRWGGIRVQSPRPMCRVLWHGERQVLTPPTTTRCSGCEVLNTEPHHLYVLTRAP